MKMSTSFCISTTNHITENADFRPPEMGTALPQGKRGQKKRKKPVKPVVFPGFILKKPLTLFRKSGKVNKNKRNDENQ